MQELQIQSESTEEFLENLKTLMVSRGIFSLKVQTEEILEKFSIGKSFFDENWVVISDIVEVEGLQGILLRSQSKNVFIICSSLPVGYVEVSEDCSYFDLSRILRLFKNSTESLNFIEIE